VFLSFFDGNAMHENWQYKSKSSNHCKSTMVCSPVLPPIFTYWLEFPFQGILSWLASYKSKNHVRFCQLKLLA
jgi:hypothetical protein